MGSGKSTHGRKLARALKAEFVDLDVYITKKLNKTISEIFEEKGEQFFRDQETEAIKEIINEKKEPCIISLGGGAVCFNDNMKLVKKNGLVIYLETHETALRQRLLRSRNKRPLLKDKSPEEVLSFIKAKIKEREKFYSQAHIKINGLNLNTATLIKELEAYYEK
jgi:shikimate kinase